MPAPLRVLLEIVENEARMTTVTIVNFPLTVTADERTDALMLAMQLLASYLDVHPLPNGEDPC